MRIGAQRTDRSPGEGQTFVEQLLVCCPLSADQIAVQWQSGKNNVEPRVAGASTQFSRASAEVEAKTKSPAKLTGALSQVDQASRQRHWISFPAQPTEHATGSKDQTGKSAAKGGTWNGEVAESLVTLMTWIWTTRRGEGIIGNIQRIGFEIRYQVLEVRGGSTPVN